MGLEPWPGPGRPWRSLEVPGQPGRYLEVSSPTLLSRTPLHCAASCNSVHLCKQLVESGAAIFASTISDIETAADKCEEMEEGYIQCSQFLYGTRGWGWPAPTPLPWVQGCQRGVLLAPGEAWLPLGSGPAVS